MIKKIFIWIIPLFSLSFSAMSALNMNVSVQRGDTLSFVPFIKGWDTLVTSVNAEISSPKHGTVRYVPSWYDSNSYYVRIGQGGSKSRMLNAPSRYPGFVYVPNTAFTGRDTFTYRIITDRDSTTTVTCEVRVTPPEPGNMEVLLVVNSLLYTSVQSEIERLRNDLRSEGYEARICLFQNQTSWKAEHAKQLWDTLAAEYRKPSVMLAGALMIGNLPYYGGSGASNTINRSSAFWCMTRYEGDLVTEVTNGFLVGNGAYAGYHYTPAFTNIWVSYLWARNAYGNELTTELGSEVVLMKRILQNNHDYRTGVSRLPHTAYGYSMHTNQAPYNYSALQSIWPNTVKHSPSDKRNPLAYEFKLGGEFFSEMTHGSANAYRSLLNGAGSEIWQYDIAKLNNSINSIRVVFGENCHSGGYGAITHRHLLTKNSGCILSVSPTDYTSMGYHPEDTSLTMFPPHWRFRNYLTNGDRFGRAWLRSNNWIWSSIFNGDLSLKPKMGPANVKPIIESLTAVKGTGMNWSFSVTAKDVDDSITGYDWYGNSYRNGIASPDSSGLITTFSKTFTEAKTCTVRVEVVDRYKARDYAEVIIKTDSAIVSLVGVTTSEVVKTNQLYNKTCSVSPNPFTGGTSVIMPSGLNSNSKVVVNIYSIDGTRVNNLKFTGSDKPLYWNGRDINGKTVSKGVYLFKVRLEGSEYHLKAYLTK